MEASKASTEMYMCTRVCELESSSYWAAGSQSVVSIFSQFVLEPYYLSSAAAGAVDLSNPCSLPVS